MSETESYTLPKLPPVVMDFASQVESQSLNAVVAGFAFASAIAWMDVVRYLISMVISVNKNNPNYYVLSALFTTILAILVYQLTKRVSRATIAQPGQAVYAVTR
jgi:uncharacterized membrane protein